MSEWAQLYYCAGICGFTLQLIYHLLLWWLSALREFHWPMVVRWSLSLLAANWHRLGLSKVSMGGLSWHHSMGSASPKMSINGLKRYLECVSFPINVCKIRFFSKEWFKSVVPFIWNAGGEQNGECWPENGTEWADKVAGEVCGPASDWLDGINNGGNGLLNRELTLLLLATAAAAALSILSKFAEDKPGLGEKERIITG